MITKRRELVSNTASAIPSPSRSRSSRIWLPIVIMVLEQLGLNIPRIETVGPNNIGEFADLLVGKLGAS